MKLILDVQACALYVKLTDEKIATTREVRPEVFADYDAKGKVVGVELVSPCVSMLRKIAKELHLPILNKIRSLPKVT